MTTTVQEEMLNNSSFTPSVFTVCSLAQLAKVSCLLGHNVFVFLFDCFAADTCERQGGNDYTNTEFTMRIRVTG